MIKQMLSSLKKVKHWQAYIAAILITLLLCLIWPSFSGDTDSGWPGFGTQTTSPPSGTGDSLEARMTETLSAIKGVGKVSVVIAYDEEVASAFSGGSTYRKACGAVVVAEGASDIGVKMELCRAVHALLGIDMSSIEVFEMHRGE